MAFTAAMIDVAFDRSPGHPYQELVHFQLVLLETCVTGCTGKGTIFVVQVQGFLDFAFGRLSLPFPSSDEISRLSLDCPRHLAV